MDQSIYAERIRTLDEICQFVNETRENIGMLLNTMGRRTDNYKMERSIIEQSNLISSSKIENLNQEDPEINNLSDRPECLYTREERLTIYDSIVGQSSSNSFQMPLMQKSNQFSNPNEMPSTYLEELALTRDLKRRRSKYRVSTKSKNYTEVMREVIANQMDLHESYVRTKRKRSDASSSSSPHWEYQKDRKKKKSY